MKTATASSIAFALITITACGSAPKPSVAACTQQIVDHPKRGPWPMCRGLTRQQLWQATAQAMMQGAKG